MEVQLAPRSRVAIVGAGRLGTVLAHAATAAGLDVCIVWSRTSSHATQLAEAIGSTPADELHEVLHDVDLVLLCVADQAVRAVVDRLAGSAAPPVTVILGSGALGMDVLEPLARRGHRVVRVHPLQALTTCSTPRDLRGVIAAITAREGKDAVEARAVGRDWARTLGMEPVDLADGDHATWHAAATMAASHTVAVLAAARDLAVVTGLRPDVAVRAFGGLAQAALERAIEETPELGLTGPVARGDVATVGEHVRAVRSAAPQLVDMYRTLSADVARRVEAAGRIDEVTRRELAEVVG